MKAINVALQNAVKENDIEEAIFLISEGATSSSRHIGMKRNMHIEVTLVYRKNNSTLNVNLI